MRRKSFNHTLGFTLIKIKENPGLSEQQKNEKITEILINATDYIGRRGLRNHSLLHQKTHDSDKT